MKKLLIIFCLTYLYNSQAIHAQDFGCGTADPTPEQREMLIRLGQAKPSRFKTETIEGVATYFPLAIYILRKTDGTGGVSELQVMRGIADLNRQFRVIDIQFYMCGGFNYVNDDTFYDFENSEEPALVSAGHFQAGKINIYYANTVKSGSKFVGGYAWLPGGPERMLIKNSQANDGKTVPHEMGHYFGLLHTFQSSNNPTISERELVTRGAGANCSLKGDLICDTPADPYEQPNGNIISACAYTGGNVDANGEAYTPMTSNIMGYYFNCGNEFTVGQYSRMQIFAGGSRNYSSATCSATTPSAPTLISLNLVGNGVTATWTDVANEVGYFIERSIDNINFTSVGVVNTNITTFSDNTVTSNTVYYYRIKPVNAPASFSNVLSITTGLIYCTPTYSGACSATGSINDFIFSQGATNLINDIATGCSASSYGNFTATPVNVSKGTTYDYALSLLTGTCFGTFSPRNMAIWVDYNQNGIFEPSEKVANDETSNICFTGSFTIPLTAQSGHTRMRIRLRERAAGSVDDACTNYGFGEVHDYTLNISGGNDNTSRVESPLTQVPTASINIGSTDVSVFKFTIRDLGTSDGLPTHVNQVKIRQGLGNNIANWVGKITNAKLLDGATPIPTTPTINATDITFSIGGTDLPIANNGSKEITLAISLGTTGFTDTDKLAFQVLASSHGFIAASTGSSEFAPTFPAAVIGNVMSIVIPPQVGDVVINEFVTEPQQDWSTNNFNGIIGGGAVSQGVDEWVELFIKRSGLDLTNWTIDLDDATPFLGGNLTNGVGSAFQVSNYISASGGTFTNTKAGDYLVLGNVRGVTSNAMNNTNLTIRLKDASGTVIDEVKVGINTTSAGGIAGSGSTGTADEAMARVPNGTKTGNDNTDFRKQTATMGKINTPDLIVTTTEFRSGNFNNVTVKNTGVLNISGMLNAEGNFLVETGGQLITDFGIVTGTGNFTMQSGTTLSISDEDGITLSGNTGAIRMSGTRNYHGDATYIYRPFKIDTQTGNGLPPIVTNLIIDAFREQGVQVSTSGNVILTRPTVVTRLVELRNGDLTSNGNLTLASDANRTAMVIQKADGSNKVIGEVTVNRHITGGQTVYPAAYAGAGGYHYFSSPIQNATVAQIADDIGLVLNPAYDWVVPYTGAFPNFYFYDENRVQATAPNDIFEKGWYSPANTSQAIQTSRGFIINVSQGNTLDFVGTLNNGNAPTGSLPDINLTRGTSTNAGWQLMGNPFPSPISWTALKSINPNIENTFVRRIPIGRYEGTWAYFTAPVPPSTVGIGMNGGEDEIAIGQGFFVRATANNVAFKMNNSVRLASVPATNPTFFRTEESESSVRSGLVKLGISQGKYADETAIYFEEGAEAQYDQYDAEKFHFNSNPVPSIYTLSEDNKNLAINGLPSLKEDFTIPLTVYTYTRGLHTIRLNEINYFKQNVQIYLEDKQLDIIHNLTQKPEYQFSVNNLGYIKDRFVVRFSTSVTDKGELDYLLLYPNPTDKELKIKMFSNYKGEVNLNVYDLSGRLHKSLIINKNSNRFENQLDLENLPQGIYIMEIIDGLGRKVKRISKL
ncbi:GEVED domain-containing protein [Thermoflexibacter ruber]|uniref:Por secretion system C-terminal sorting domain-containing protein n=1 Tax=Thermoflexibacter ruber TaxID=1003 RepID=A0A1I2F2N4_9BACT|nr:GEVED domain-containing protein [Thermoflexibacter ruber]SFE99279.1 Por secretion system C-terminal sorting domain-containing protein [Thermoflexibacter ruber]